MEFLLQRYFNGNNNFNWFPIIINHIILPEHISSCKFLRWIVMFFFIEFLGFTILIKNLNFYISRLDFFFICLWLGLKLNQCWCVCLVVVIVWASQRTRQMNVMWSVSANMHTPFWNGTKQTPLPWLAASERVCFAATALYKLIISAALARIIQRTLAHSLIYMLIWRAVAARKSLALPASAADRPLRLALYV